ncbi:hypothetical protein AVW22_24310 [Salmonella enterica]|nr:hypothetical protein [Salmonella enterica]
MKININKGMTGDVVVLNQSSFNNDVDSLHLKMTPEFQRLIRQHCSGAFDVSICALLEYGIERIRKENLQIRVNKLDKEVSIEIDHKKSDSEAYITVNYKASRSETRSVFVRMNKGLKGKLKEISTTNYTISALGIIKYAIDSLKAEKLSLIVKSEAVYE